MAEKWLFGPDPTGWQVAGIALHAATCALLLAALRRLCHPALAFALAALFATMAAIADAVIWQHINAYAVLRADPGAAAAALAACARCPHAPAVGGRGALRGNGRRASPMSWATASRATCALLGLWLRTRARQLVPLLALAAVPLLPAREPRRFSCAPEFSDLSLCARGFNVIAAMFRGPAIVVLGAGARLVALPAGRPHRAEFIVWPALAILAIVLLAAGYVIMAQALTRSSATRSCANGGAELRCSPCPRRRSWVTYT